MVCGCPDDKAKDWQRDRSVQDSTPIPSAASPCSPEPERLPFTAPNPFRETSVDRVRLAMKTYRNNEANLVNVLHKQEWVVTSASQVRSIVIFTAISAAKVYFIMASWIWFLHSAWSLPNWAKIWTMLREGARGTQRIAVVTSEYLGNTIALIEVSGSPTADDHAHDVGNRIKTAKIWKVWWKPLDKLCLVGRWCILLH